MGPFKPTLIDTIHLLAIVTVIGLLIGMVIARQQPAWSDFTLQSMAVLAASAILGRLIGWKSRHQ